MNILYVCRQAFPISGTGHVGGIGRYVEMVSKGIRDLGVQVTVFSQNDTNEFVDSEVDGIRVCYLPKWEKGMLHWRLEKFWNSMVKSSIGKYLWADVSPKLNHAKIVAKYIPIIERNQKCPFSLIEFAECGAEGFFYIKSTGHAPVVTRVHTPTQALIKLNKTPKRFGHKILIHLERTMTRNSDAVTAPSNSAAQLAVTDWKLHTKTPICIPNPIDTQKFFPGTKGPTCRLIIFYSGRIEWRKGMGTVPELLKCLKNQKIDFEIRMAGKDTMTAPNGESMVRWLQQRLSPDDRNRLVFLGQLGDLELIKELQSASIGLYLSSYETFGYTCLESLSCGTPVVASRFGGMGEIVIDGKTGVLVNPDDIGEITNAVMGFVNQPERIKTFGINARNSVVATYSLYAVCRKMLDFYEDLCLLKHYVS